MITHLKKPLAKRSGAGDPNHPQGKNDHTDF
jgi:hypothetical protein